MRGAKTVATGAVRDGNVTITGNLIVSGTSRRGGMTARELAGGAPATKVAGA